MMPNEKEFLWLLGVFFLAAVMIAGVFFLASLALG